MCFSHTNNCSTFQFQLINYGNKYCSSRMNKSCCFVLQYNTKALVLVLQYYFGK
jgi:hypothetical protein